MMFERYNHLFDRTAKRVAQNCRPDLHRRALPRERKKPKLLAE
jgi:hypothetical protein